MMNFTEASQELNRLYPERYNTTKMELIRHHDGTLIAECSVYVDGMKHHSGATWEEAFNALEASKRSEEDIFQMAA